MSSIVADLRRLSFARVRALLVFIGWFAPSAAWALSADHLTVNGRTNPLGIGADEISFAWAIAADTRGVHHVAYQVRVGTTEGGSEVWDRARTDGREVYRKAGR